MGWRWKLVGTAREVQGCNLLCLSDMKSGYTWRWDNFICCYPSVHKPSLLVRKTGSGGSLLLSNGTSAQCWPRAVACWTGLGLTALPGTSDAVPAAASSPRWQMTHFLPSFPNVAVLCKSSDLVFQLCNTNNHNM